MPLSKIDSDSLNTPITAVDLAYTGTLTGGTGIVNLGSGQVYKDASGNVGIGTSSPYKRLNATKASSTAYSASDFDIDSLALQLANTTNDKSTGIYFAIGSNGEAAISAVETSDGETALTFGTRGSGSRPERARIDSSGNLLVGTTSTDITAVGIRLMNNNQLQASKSSDWSLRTGRRDSTGIIQEIYYNSSRVGDIATNGTGTTYNSASDYRLKENIQPMTGALSRNALLNPVKYKWKVDGSDGEGFIADQLQGPFPSAVTGEKDAVDADGNPIYQSIGTGPLDGHFAACVNELQTIIQELKAIVDAQGAEIAALKGTP